MAFSSLRSRFLRQVARSVERGTDNADALHFEKQNHGHVLAPVAGFDPALRFMPSGDSRLDDYAEIHNRVAKSVVKITAVYDDPESAQSLLVSSSAFAVSEIEAWTADHTIRTARYGCPLSRVHYSIAPREAATMEATFSQSAYKALAVAQDPILELVHSDPERAVLKSPYTRTSAWTRGQSQGGLDFASLRAREPVFKSYLRRASEPPKVGDRIFVQGYPVGVIKSLVDYIEKMELRKTISRSEFLTDEAYEAELLAVANDTLSCHFGNLVQLCVASGTVLAVDADGLIAMSTCTTAGFAGGPCYNTKGEFVGIHIGGMGREVKLAHNVALSAFYPTLNGLYRNLGQA